MKARKFASRARLIPTAKPSTLSNLTNPAKPGDQGIWSLFLSAAGVACLLPHHMSRLFDQAGLCDNLALLVLWSLAFPSAYQERPLKFRQPVLAVTALFVLALPIANAQVDEATKQLSHDIFKELIEINTTDSVGSVTAAAEAMAKRLRDAGFADSDLQVLGPNDRKKNTVVRLRGTGKHKPVLLIGHLDVVEARREDWTTDPFQFVEKDGFFYGRGTQDMKSGDAIMSTTLIRFKKEGYVPDRDIILALTADEEGGTSNGVDWLLKNHRDLIDAEFVLNHDGGGVTTNHGKPEFVAVDATEKLYADYKLTVTNPGGHSSLPVPDNAIYHLAAGLGNRQRTVPARI